MRQVVTFLWFGALVLGCDTTEAAVDKGKAVAEKAVEGYNLMGVAKASLEASVRYLAANLGPQNVRVNAISAGPVNTLAARGIKGFTGMLKHHADRAPLRRNVELEEIGNAGLFLLSHMSSAITGEIMFVDCGYNIVGL